MAPKFVIMVEFDPADVPTLALNDPVTITVGAAGKGSVVGKLEHEKEVGGALSQVTVEGRDLTTV